MNSPAGAKEFETPRHRIVSIRISPMVELARWLFELQGLPYAESTHAPVFHLIFTLLARGGGEVPVVVAPEAVWIGGRNVALRLAALAPASKPILSRNEAAFDAEVAFVDELFGLLLRQVRRKVYFHLLDEHKALVTPMVTTGAPALERRLIESFYPFWKFFMHWMLKTKNRALVDQAPEDIRKAFDLVEKRLGDKRFLGGDAPCGLDFIFAALVAGVIFPEGYGGAPKDKPIIPTPAQLPDPLRKFVNEMRDRRAGQLTLDVYQFRTNEQPSMKLAQPKKSWRSPSLLIWFLNRLRRIRPRLRFGKWLFLLNWADVRAILDNDVSFKIGRINRNRIRTTGNHFILEMDRSARLLEERAPLYAALHRLDLDAIRALARTESERLLLHAARGYPHLVVDDKGVEKIVRARAGRIDVVNGYARLVAARCAVKMFGVPGPSEPDLMRVSRDIFHHAFFNLRNDRKVGRKGAASGRELRAWIEAEIARRRESRSNGDDVLGALLIEADKHGLNDDFVRRSLAGMIVGAIDTTTTAVVNIVIELMRDEKTAAQVYADIDDDERLTHWCWELLRRRPHNPFLLRSVEEDVEIDDYKIARGSTIFVLTLAAMHDPAVFVHPGKLDPTRPLDRYLHFGAGIHRCAGRVINAVQIPEIVRALMRAGPYKMEAPRFDRDFPDKLILDIKSRSD